MQTNDKQILFLCPPKLCDPFGIYQFSWWYWSTMNGTVNIQLKYAKSYPKNEKTR